MYQISDPIDARMRVVCGSQHTDRAATAHRGASLADRVSYARLIAIRWYSAWGDECKDVSRQSRQVGPSSVGKQSHPVRGSAARIGDI